MKLVQDRGEWHKNLEAEVYDVNNVLDLNLIKLKNNDGMTYDMTTLILRFQVHFILADRDYVMD